MTDSTVRQPRAQWLRGTVHRLPAPRRLDHVILYSKAGLRRTLQAYTAYYLRSRTHLALNKDAPVPRPISGPAEGTIVAVPQLGDLHHRYERRGA
jgi:hypothetical protein